MINIGQRIKQEVDRQARGISWLSQNLGYSRQSIYRMFERNSVDTHLLYRISRLLHHNFFRDLADDLSADFDEFFDSSNITDLPADANNSELKDKKIGGGDSKDDTLLFQSCDTQEDCNSEDGRNFAP